MRVGEMRFLFSSHGYDARANLASVINIGATGQAVASHTYTLDALNRRNFAAREDGTQWDYEYNDRHEVTKGKKRFQANAESSFGGATLASTVREYTYDNIGNRLTAAEGGNAAGGSLRAITHTPNDLNLYTQISRSSRAVDFVGTAGLCNALPAICHEIDAAAHAENRGHHQNESYEAAPIDDEAGDRSDAGS